MDLQVFDRRFADIARSASALTRLCTGAVWSEGPVWLHEDQSLLCSDIPNNRMLRWHARTGMTVWRDAVDYTNGHAREAEKPVRPRQRLPRPLQEDLGPVVAVKRPSRPGRFSLDGRPACRAQPAVERGRAHPIAPWAAWHARCMVLAWAVRLPLGALVARFCKVMPGQRWPQRLDNPAWWHAHRVYAVGRHRSAGACAGRWVDGPTVAGKSRSRKTRCTGWGRVMAVGSLIAIAPLLFTFVAARQISGLTAGAVKG